MTAPTRQHVAYASDSFAGRHVSDIADLLRNAAQALQAAEGLLADGDTAEALEIMVDQMRAVQEALTLMKCGVVAAIHPYSPGD